MRSGSTLVRPSHGRDYIRSPGHRTIPRPLHDRREDQRPREHLDEAGSTRVRDFDGRREREDEEGKREPVIQPALDVQRLADRRRHLGARDDRLAEGGVGGREADGDERQSPEVDAREEDQPEEPTDDHGERHADQQEPARESALRPPVPGADRKRIGEQHERQRHLQEDRDRMPIFGPVDHVEHGGPSRTPRTMKIIAPVTAVDARRLLTRA